jgi:hypothetical protein
MELVRDCLDKQAVDRVGNKMGRIDGIVLLLSKEQPPTVEAVEISAFTVVQRLHGGLAKRLLRVFAWFTGHAPEPYRVAWKKVSFESNNVVLDVDWESSRAVTCENWVRRLFIDHIPGA